MPSADPGLVVTSATPAWGRQREHSLVVCEQGGGRSVRQPMVGGQCLVAVLSLCCGIVDASALSCVRPAGVLCRRRHVCAHVCAEQGRCPWLLQVVLCCWRRPGARSGGQHCSPAACCLPSESVVHRRGCVGACVCWVRPWCPPRAPVFPKCVAQQLARIGLAGM
jgi:hypothetical protein